MMLSFRRLLQKRLSAFSLMEISIVLVIIGVLLGLVLSQTDLIGSTKLKATLIDIQRYRMAVSEFQSRYHALPGDFRDAQSRLGPGVENGNGDGRVVDGEVGQFWAHLRAADLVTGGTGELTTPPLTPLGGVFTPVQDPHGWGGLWLRLGQGAAGEESLLTPAQAQELDLKLDNGNPTTGKIRAAGEGCLQNQHYNLAIKDAACTVYVKL